MKIGADYILPDDNGFTDQILDEYLALGFYRMQHIIFTTHQTQLDAASESVPVFWLRILVAAIQEQKSATTIRKKCNAFTVVYKKAAINTEVDTLYRLYRNKVNFNTSETCGAYLHQFEFKNPFNSYMVEVRDGEQLIAVGYFDKGANAIAGILNFYHPNYSKYSLGKYLILKKIDYAIENSIPLYYTGYISTISNKFDYKLFPDIAAIQVYLPVENEWVAYTFLGKNLLHHYFLHYIL